MAEGAGDVGVGVGACFYVAGCVCVCVRARVCVCVCVCVYRRFEGAMRRWRSQDGWVAHHVLQIQRTPLSRRAIHLPERATKASAKMSMQAVVAMLPAPPRWFPGRVIWYVVRRSLTGDAGP